MIKLEKNNKDYTACDGLVWIKKHLTGYTVLINCLGIEEYSYYIKDAKEFINNLTSEQLNKLNRCIEFKEKFGAKFYINYEAFFNNEAYRNKEILNLFKYNNTCLGLEILNYLELNTDLIKEYFINKLIEANKELTIASNKEFKFEYNYSNVYSLDYATKHKILIELFPHITYENVLKLNSRVTLEQYKIFMIDLTNKIETYNKKKTNETKEDYFNEYLYNTIEPFIKLLQEKLNTFYNIISQQSQDFINRKHSSISRLNIEIDNINQIMKTLN